MAADGQSGRKPLVTCQCTRLPERCHSTATAEDFLCDSCRNGCNGCIMGESSIHLAVGPISVRFGTS